MAFQLHTRAGLSPPFSSFAKRYLNTGTGGTSGGLIGELKASSAVIIELETQLGQHSGTSRDTLFAGDISNSASSSEVGIHWYADGLIGVSGGGNGRRVFSADAYSEGDVLKIRWELVFPSAASGVTGTQTLYINDVSQGSGQARSDAFNNSSRTFALNSRAANDTSVLTENYADQYIRRFYVNWVDANYERNWIFNQSSGFIVPDALGSGDSLFLYGGNGINELGSNWPEDDSQWVFYDDGGAVESAVAATWPLFQALASQSSTVPDIASDIAAQWPIFGVSVSQGAQVPDIDSTIAAAWPLFTVQANQASELPQYQATIETTWPMFSASVSQQSEVPQYDSDLAATWPLFNVSAEQGFAAPAIEITAAVTWPLFAVAANQESQLPEGATSIAVTWPLFSVDASQQSAVPEFDSTIAAAWPLFQVSTSQQQELPSGATAIAIEWPLFGIQASQESTIPEFTATVAATWPLFSVSILAGEFEFFAPPKARVDIPNLSRRVDIPSLSRRIDI